MTKSPEKPFKCDCQICSVGHRLDLILKSKNPLTKEQKSFLRDFYDDHIGLQEDLQYANAVIDGSWENADDIIEHRRRYK